MQKIDYPAIGETLYEDRLRNGLPIRIVTKPGYTRSHAFFATNYGGADRDFYLNGNALHTPAGVAHFLEHKMFDMPDGSDALMTLAANCASPNAYTSSGITAYFFEGTDRFYDNLKTLLTFVSTPYFTEKSVAKEQGIIGQEIRMYEDSPDSVVYETLMRMLYANHPIRDNVAGTVESIAEITPQVLYDCHKVFYNPGNMCLSVVGDVDPERVRDLAEELLPADGGALPQRDYGAPETLLPVETRGKRCMEVSAPQMVIGCKLPYPEEGEARLRSRLVCGKTLQYLFGASSTLYNRLYAGGLVNSDFFAEMDTAAGTATCLIGGETKDPEAVFSAVCEAAAVLAKEGPDPELFRRQSRANYGADIRSLKSFSGLCHELADGEFSGFRSMERFALSEQITAEELQRYAAENLTEERFAMSVIDPIERGNAANA